LLVYVVYIQARCDYEQEFAEEWSIFSAMYYYQEGYSEGEAMWKWALVGYDLEMKGMCYLGSV
jgi:hypothetical protein